MKNFIVSLIAFLSLVSCATSPSALIPPSFAPNATNGMIVGTIAIENQKPLYNQYFFHYSKDGVYTLSTEKMVTVRPEQLAKMKFKPDFYDNNKAVYYFSITENQGKYQFTTLRLHTNMGYIQSQSKLPLYAPFEIEKGKVKYIGELYYNSATGALEISDQRERDISKFKENYPGLKIEQSGI